MPPTIEELVDGLLPNNSKAAETAAAKNAAPVYPELLLHQLGNANRYYNSFQRYTRQFVANTSQNNVLQFSHSRLGLLLALKVLAWDQVDSEFSTTQLHTEPGRRTAAALISLGTANSLFSWALGEKYILARKLELQNKSTNSSSSSPKPKELQKATTPPISRYKQSMTQRISNVVEKESNKFIQDRIQIIKAHHLEQASRKIDERKKRDHELYLRRIRNKENEYEQAIKAAIASKDLEKRSLGIFGSLFGINSKSISSSFILNISNDTETKLSDTENSMRTSVESCASRSSRPGTPTPTPKTFLRNSLKSSRPASPAIPQAEASPKRNTTKKPYDPYLPSSYPVADDSLPVATFPSQDLLL